jgi:hypothetical protein
MRRHLGRLRGHRHQRVHEARIFAAPDPGVHAAHRVADHEPEMLDAEPFGEQPIMRIDHVLVIILREHRLHAVRRLRRFAVADAVGNDDVVFRRIERLAGAEQFAAEIRRQHAGRRAARAVQHQHRLPARLADRGVVQPQLGHRLAGVEFEIPGDPVALFRRGIVGCESGDGHEGEDCREGRARQVHDGLPQMFLRGFAAVWCAA